MTDPETPPTAPDAPPAAKQATLSTAVDQDLYDWFVEHAKANFRNISGQLAYVLHRYRQDVEGGADPEAFGRAVLSGIRKHQPSAPQPNLPYVGDWPRPTVTWGSQLAQAPSIEFPGGPVRPDESMAEPLDSDDPEEGVK